MMSFKRILILLTVSKLISYLSGLNSGIDFVVANESGSALESKIGDGVVVDDEGDVFYDALSELPESKGDTKDEVVKTETVVTKQEGEKPETVITKEEIVRKDAPITGTTSSVPGSTNTKVEYKKKTVYIPKREVKRVVRPVGRDFVASTVLGKRTQTTETEGSDYKQSRITTLPEVELPGIDDLESVQSYGVPPPLPPKKVRFKDLPTEVEEKLLTKALKMGTFTSFGKPDEEGSSGSNVVVSDEELYFDAPESEFENVNLNFISGQDGVPRRGLNEIPSPSKSYYGIKNSAKGVIGSATKRVHGAAHKTAKEAGKIAYKVKYTSKDLKSHVAGRMVQAKDFIGNAAHQTARGGVKLGEKVKELSNKHYQNAKTSAKATADAASRNIAKAAQKTVTGTGKLGEKLKDKTRVAFKDIKTTTRVTMNDASKNIHGAAHKTAKTAAQVGQKIKDKSDNFATGAKQTASVTKVRLQGAAHKVAKEAGKLGDNIKTSGSKTKGSVSRYFKNRFEKVTPEDEVTRM